MSFRYYGSKKSLAAWITALLPRHVCYVEPYGGSAAVLLYRNPPAPREVYNDLDDQVVTLFRVLRERPAELAAQVAFTPYARREVELARQPVSPTQPDYDLEVARRFLIRAGQTRAGASRRDVHWIWQKAGHRGGYYPAEWAELPAELLRIAARLKHVQIEHTDALTTIVRYDSPQTCFYLDPPYLFPHKQRAGTYRHEMTPDEHRELAEVLHTLTGMALISGVSGAYDELYRDWRRECLPVVTGSHTVVQECVWLSPAAQRYAPQPRLWAELADAL